MKRTLTVNLSGVVYHIDEDAYSLLDKYLRDIRSHLRQSEEVQEVMEDIENRISELFSEKINQGLQVVTIQTVEEVINRMGSPETYAETDSRQEEPKQNWKNKRKEGKNRKRIYRNPDDKMLGGVASGIAAYIDADPVWVRLAFVLLTIVWGVTIPVYLLCWIIIPPAETAAEKLEMRGEEINLENIGKTVTETFNQVADNVNDFVKSKKTRSSLEKLGDVIATLASVCLKSFGLFIGVLAAILLFCLAIGIVALLAVYVFGMMNSWEYIFNIPINQRPEVILALIFSGVMVAGIPIYSLFHAVLKGSLRWKPMSEVAKWTLVIIWVVAVFFSIYLGIYVNKFY